jgi:L-cysteine:1D-myo-inositol 2-amino-2-deoxy-alpha-D-glucopyranoside ligase
MRLYDTARMAVVPFEPRGSSVTLYVCGITPYDSAHVGHAFTYHVFDVLVRRLRARGISVRSVRNVTDVDDDIFRVARERNLDPRALAESEVTLFEREMRDIGIVPVDAMPRASEHVPAMVAWIERLAGAGFAYAVGRWVYFDTALYPAYGQLSRLDRATMIALSRERGADPDDRRKRDPLDFVLWQPSAPGEPRWPSPWGDGRPGWHIECSVLATASLGTPIDIHGGGDDLIYPHHESEIAQAEGAGVRPYVRHWMHVAMVRQQGEKMSKSLGNLVFVHDLLERFPASSVRLLLAAHHYREPWTYDEAELHDADRRLARYSDAMLVGSWLAGEEAASLEAAFAERLDDDLDTPGALRLLDAAAERLLEARGRPAAAAAPVSGEELMSRLLDALGSRAPSLAA